MKKFNILIIFIILFNLSCSRLDLASKFANTYVIYKADDYFDLSSTQKNWLRLEFEKNFTTIKKQIIPKVTAELYRLSKTLAQKKEFSETDVEIEYQKINYFFYETIKTFKDSAKIFANQLLSNQVDYFQMKLKDRLSDFQDRVSQKSSTKRLKSSFDDWFGDLTIAQEKEIENFVVNNPFPVELMVEHRQKLSRDFKEAIKIENSRNSFIETLFTNYSSMIDPGYSRAKSEREKNLIKLVVKILNSMNEEQKIELASSLNEKANQLAKII